ncbi:MAG: hypothetical protein IJ109_02930 [Firmicutes bacterium]|nr:hypothetical protein [Bacillota bacterium]
MYSDKVKKTTLLIVSLLILCLIAAALVWWAVSAGTRNMKEEGVTALKQTITSAARQCYVVEGVYPSDLAYLEDNYGLRINKDDYYVTYEAFAQNLPPTVRVTLR